MSEALAVAERALWAVAGARPSERWLDLAAPRIRVRVQEVGVGPPALFLHGVMTAGSSFATLAARLPALRCIMLDRPGCGASEAWPPRALSFRADAIDVIGSVLDALELERVTLVGSSLGALWSTWFALARPERVDRLVLLGPSIGFPGVRPPAFLRLLSLPGLGAVMLGRMKPTPAAMRQVIGMLGHRRSIEAGLVPDELFAWGSRLASDTPTRPNERELARRAVGPFGARAWTKLSDDDLRAIASPTVIVSGDADPHAGPPVARRIAELIPGSTLVVLDGGIGHLPWLDDPRTVADAIAERRT